MKIIMFKEKYREIYDQITPDERLLADTLTLGSDKSMYKTKPRQQMKRIYRITAIPTGALVSLFIAFVFMVNLSLTFAMALEDVPVLGELSALVSFSLRDTVSYSPSLSEAIENDYVQHIGQEQIIDDITLRIEYIIVDQKQLHVFFTLQSEHYNELFPYALTLLNANGIPLEGYTVFTSRSKLGYWAGEVTQDDLRHYIFDFTDSEIPDNLIFECGVYDSTKSEYEIFEKESSIFTSTGYAIMLTTFSIPITFDSGLIPETKIITVDQEFILDDQVLVITTIEFLPTHTRVNITEHEHNTAWLKSMSCYIIDENGNRYDSTPYNDDQWSHGNDRLYNYLESIFFSESLNLTLVIIDAIWLEKDVTPARIDLTNCKAINLPAGVEIIDAARVNNDWALAFTAPVRNQIFYDPFYDDMARWSYRLFEGVFHDESGNEHSISTGWITNEGYEKWRFYTEKEIEEELFAGPFVLGVDGTWEFVKTPGLFGLTKIIKEYPYDILYMKPVFSYISVLDTPIEIIVR